MPLLPSKRSAQGKSLRVLVVQNRADTANAWAKQLGLFGHEPLTALDGQTALEASSANPPDVVLLAMDLPGAMNGWQVARRLQEQPARKRPLLIAISGKDNPQQAQEAGIDLHLPEPVDLALLQKLLGRFQSIIS